MTPLVDNRAAAWMIGDSTGIFDRLVNQFKIDSCGLDGRHVSTVRGGPRKPRKRTATKAPVVGWPRTFISAGRELAEKELS